MKKLYDLLAKHVGLVYEKTKDTLRPRKFLKFPLVKVTVKEIIAHKSLKKTKIH